MAADSIGSRPGEAPVSRSWLTPRFSLWIGVVLWVIGFTLSCAGVVLLALNQAVLAAHPRIPLYSIWLTSGFPYVVLGGLIVVRRPENSIGWLLGLGGLAGVLSYTAEQYAVYALLTRPGVLPLGAEAIWLAGWLWTGWVGIVPFFILLFPTGKTPSRRWGWVVWLDCVILLAISLPSAVEFWPLRGTGLLDESNVPAGATALFDATFGPLVLTGLIVSLVAAVVRYRRARDVERAQIRWIIYAGFFGTVMMNVLSSTLLAGTPLHADATALISGTTISFLFLPISIGVAIFRYHLFDIDRLINRTLVYGLLTAILVGFYFGGVVLLQSLLRPITGAGNDLAIVVTTLIIAALFMPLRSRLQAFIDRRFYRRKYDAARTLAEFGQVARDEVDLESLKGRLVQVIEETMQPEHVSLWLRPTLSPRKENAR